MLLQKAGGSEESGLGFGGFADLFDSGGGNHGGLVAEGVTDIGENGGEFFVGKGLKGGHGHLAGVFFAFHLDGAEESVEGEFDETVFVAIDPFRFAKRRKHRGGEALSIGLVTGDAVAFAGVDFVSFFEEAKGVFVEGAGGVRDFFGGIPFDILTFEVGGGGFEDGLEPFVDGVFFDFGEDWEADFWIQPRGGDGGLKSHARRFIRSEMLEHGGGIFDLIAV